MMIRSFEEVSTIYGIIICELFKGWKECQVVSLNVVAGEW
jgi:hypothetical protein